MRGVPLRVGGYEEGGRGRGGGSGVGEAVWKGGGMGAGETTRDASCDLSPLGQGQWCLVACQQSMAPVESLIPLATLLPYATLAAGICSLVAAVVSRLLSSRASHAMEGRPEVDCWCVASSLFATPGFSQSSEAV